MIAQPIIGQDFLLQLPPEEDTSAGIVVHIISGKYKNVKVKLWNFRIEEDEEKNTLLVTDQKIIEAPDGDSVETDEEFDQLVGLISLQILENAIRFGSKEEPVAPNDGNTST